MTRRRVNKGAEDRHFLGERAGDTGSHRIGKCPEAGPCCQSSKNNERSKEQSGRKAKQGWGAGWVRMGQMVRNLKEHRSELLGQTSVS